MWPHDKFFKTHSDKGGPPGKPSSQFSLNEARDKETYSLRARKRAKRTDVPSSAPSTRKFAQRVYESGRRCAEVGAQGVIGKTDRGKKAPSVLEFHFAFFGTARATLMVQNYVPIGSGHHCGDEL